MGDETGIDELNRLVCAKDGWRHVYVEKWVKVEGGTVVLEKVVSAYIDGGLEVNAKFDTGNLEAVI
jgi:hypothetical protein